MAIHCKSTGLMVAGRVLEETAEYWKFHAADEKRSKKIPKGDPKQKVFSGTSTRVLDQVEKWMQQWEKADD
ncbi:MAG: hypothetical protein G3W58_22955 [Pantoea ananatis]|nr:hypothetical protein [Pantoea ananatis]